MATKKYSDEELIKMIQANIDNRRLAWNYIANNEDWFKMVRSQVSIKDISEFREHYWNSIEKFDLRIRKKLFRGDSSLSTYFVNISKWLYIEKLEKERKEKEKLEELRILLLQQQDSYQFQSLSLEERNQKEIYLANHFLEQIDDRCAQILLLDVHSYSHREIAEELDIEDSNTIRQIKYNCFQKLIRLVKKDPYYKVIEKILYE